MLGAVAVVAVVRSGPTGDGASSGGYDEVDGVPVLAGAYRTDGDLGDGLVVPEGTALLGDVLPATEMFVPPFPGRDGDGWEATLLMVGDMADVLDDLARQATDLGLELHDDDFYGDGCGPSGYQPPEGMVVCRFAWIGGDAWLQAEAWRGVVPAGTGAVEDRPVSLLFVGFARPVPGASAGTTTVVPPTVIAPPALRSRRPGPAQPSPGDVPDEPLPDGWAEPPGPGDHVGDGITPPDDDSVLSLRLPEGVHSVVAPWPTGGNARNHGALLAVDGGAEADAVIDDLAAQVSDWFGPDARVNSGDVDGIERRTVRGDQAGGSKLDLVAVPVGARTWITVETGYD